MSKPLRTLLVSDFNVDILAGYMRNDADMPALDVTVAAFGQVLPVLLDEANLAWKEPCDNLFVWTQPEGVIESFQKAIDFHAVSMNEILFHVDQFCDALMAASTRVGNVFISAWSLPTYHRGWGMLEMKHGLGLTNIIAQMNVRLAENLKKGANIHILNTQKWIEHVGYKSFNPKLWYMGKIPFDGSVFKHAVKDVKAALNGIYGGARKLIIVDLDDTLWGGIVGDDGWRNLQLGGHDPVGEACVDFQKALKGLQRRGLILGIVSKNEESVALEAIERHPEMVLKQADFAGWRINWHDKAKNIVELAQELNLGLQSVVFIDDNRAERSRVKDALPEVLVPEWPEDKMLYKQALLSLRCFDHPQMTEEDKKRVEMYAQDQKRRQAKVKVGSVEEWLKSLKIKIKVEHLNEVNLQRTVQLLNKTNQMNLTTRRMSKTEYAAWNKKENVRTWTFRVSDKLGDSGLTGIVSVESGGGELKIIDFILSCRVFGRKVEDVMIKTLYDFAQNKGIKTITARYLPTEKNRPCLDFFNRSVFQYNRDKGIYVLDVNGVMAAPRGVSIDNKFKSSVNRINEFINR